MRIWLQLVTAVVAGLAALTAASGAAPPERQVSTAAAPVIVKLSPATLGAGRRLTIHGRRFAVGKSRNRVVFVGGPGRRDDVTARATSGRRRSIVLRPRRDTPSGRVRVVNRFGRSSLSRGRVTFDDDLDGLSNERERRLGTNPRRRDTDGDGLPDRKDPDPLRPPAPPPPPPPEPPPPPPSPPDNPPSDCPSAAAPAGASGPASGFDGLENVIHESRSLISHTAYPAAPVGGYCLYRKRRGDPDSTYQLVGSDLGPEAGVIRDGQRPFKNEDYVYRTDAVTGAGVVAGSSTVAARGAGSIANVDGWAQINQSCASCGSAGVQTGALKAAATGAGSPGPAVGEVAVFHRRLGFTAAGEWVARALTPQTPAAGGTYAGASLTISDAHPAVARGAQSVADPTDSGRPFIDVQLRALQNGDLVVRATDSTGFSSTSGDIRGLPGVIHNTYLVVDPLANGQYEVRYKTNLHGADVVLVPPRAAPPGLSSAWLSLRAEVSSEESAEHDARFDEVFVSGEALDEDFGGVAANTQVPVGFDVQTAIDGLTAPTAVEFAPNGDMFISERGGAVKRRDHATGTVSPVLDISSDVNAPALVDQGLLGFALDPGFVGDGSLNDFAYLSYTVDADPGTEPDEEVRTVSRVERVKFNGTAFDPATRTVLVGGDGAAPGTGDTCPPATTSDCLPSDAYTHSAGAVGFDADGKLWITTPDGASPEGTGSGGTDPLALRAQNTNSLAGKILRVDPASGDGVTGNPGFASLDADSPASRTWARGFRNPFRFAQRPDGTHALYLTDVGWGAWEEANVIPTAAPPIASNYGWPCLEGIEGTEYMSAFPSDCPDPLPARHDPLYAYDSFGVDHAIIGSAFYTGSSWPAPWKPPAGGASFFYSDYPSGEITRLETDSSDSLMDLDVFASGFAGAVDLSEGPANLGSPGADKALYVVAIGDVSDLSATDGKVWRIVHTGP
jgi:glucose/arabinose dehydrogenase